MPHPGTSLRERCDSATIRSSHPCCTRRRVELPTLDLYSVARPGHQEQRAISACRHRSLDNLPPQNRFFRADRHTTTSGDCSAASITQPTTFRRIALPVRPPGRASGSSHGAARFHDPGDTTPLLVIVPPPIPTPCARSAPKNAFRQFHAGGSHGHRRVPSSVSVRTRFPTSRAPWKRPIQHRPGCAILVREAIRFPHLARISARPAAWIEPRRNSKQMPDGLAIVVVISDTLRTSEAPNETRSESRKSRAHSWRTPRHAYTSLRLHVREHQRLLENSPRA